MSRHWSSTGDAPAVAGATRARVTLLSVPGDRPDRHAKACAAPCDEVILDLEDSVAPARKDQARADVVRTLADPAWRTRTVAVRVNAGDLDDLEAVASCAGIAGLTVVLPKVEAPEDVHAVAVRLEGTGIGIQALLETPRGTMAAHEIAAADPSLVSVIIGYADLGAALGRRHAAPWLVHQERVLGAARTHGLQAIDGPFLGLADEPGLVESTRVARDLGFDGKWAIHPRQLPVISSVFALGAGDLAARAAAALAAGDGVAVVDGTMVDAAHLRGLSRPDAAPTPARRRSAPSRPPAHRSVAAPYGDELSVGDEFTAPGLTIDASLQTLHRAICGDRLAIGLDAALAERVTGHAGLIVHPCVLADVAIGQSTEPSGRVLGNLFYRGVTLSPTVVGSTLRTTTRVEAIAPTRDGRSAKVTLSATTVDTHGRTVASYLRCPLLPARRPVTEAGAAPELEPEILVPDWDLAAHPQGDALVPGDSFAIEAAETITSAPELVRATLNLAMTHVDAEAGAHDRRLVYGGHVMGIGLAHACRALRGLVTVLAWRSCDHLGPAFGGDRLTTRVDVLAVDDPTVELRIRVDARDATILDWVVVALYAG